MLNVVVGKTHIRLQKHYVKVSIRLSSDAFLFVIYRHIFFFDFPHLTNRNLWLQIGIKYIVKRIQRENLIG